MSTTEAPAVTYALPTSSAGGEHILESLGLDPDEVVEWGPDHECPDDLRSTLYDAISHGFDQQMAGWELLPRKVHRHQDVVRVSMVPVFVQYEDEREVEPQQSPRQRVLAVMDEYHQEQREDYVPREALFQGTQADQGTVNEAIERLLREGEIYAVGDGEREAQRYRRTGWS